MSTQRILLYVISGVMILSLAASFIIGSTGRRVAPVDPGSQIESTDPSAAENGGEETATDEANATDEVTADDTVDGEGTETDSETESQDEETSDPAGEETSTPENAGEPDAEN